MKGKEPFWKSRRVWSAGIVALSGATLMLVELGYIPEVAYLKIGQIVGSIAGAFGVSHSWIKPKKLS